MPSSLLLLLLLLLLPVLLQAGPALTTPDTSLEVRGQRTPRDAKQDSIKVLISEGCATQGDSSEPSPGGKELDLALGAPLVLTHRIKLLPSGSGSGACGCEADFAALRERLESLEREVSSLRENCGGAEGSCCSSKESKGAGCSIKPECPNECSDQGRCVDGRCVCFAGFSGPDCSESDCPGNCNDNGKCVNGQCVCDPGFTGPDCSDASCPGNCNRRGRCVNGQCVCNPGFTGPDCSQKACPDNCNDRGRCVNGKCVCDGGFTGADCSESSCPGNCNSRGRCVNGQCVCDDGFTGPDCSEKTCPNNCSNRGRCVNGKCVCEVGFSGPDCSVKGCPNNCNSRGRCVNGRCVCRRGFTGPDCSQCQAGMTGPNCDQVMSAVSQLSAQDITETSVTLVWTPPAVQYETYYITFSSQKESDQQISVQVEGSLTAFTQTGLAAGQEYRASIVGEADGKRGAESTAEFMTLISGPSDLKVVKTTTTSAVVQWERSQGEIDRYRLTITPNDGAGRSREMTVPADQNSAHIQQLEAGRLYDITLVAEKGSSRSKAATAQAVPGSPSHSVSTAATPSPPPEQFPSPDEVPVRTKPVVIKMLAVNGTRPKLTGRPAWPRKPKIPGAFRFNATRAVPGGRRLVPDPLKKAPMVVKKKEQMVPKEPKPDVQTVRDPGAERRDDKHPAPESVTDSETNGQSGSEEPTAASGSKEQPDVGMAGSGNDTDPESPEPTGTAQSQEKKCMNKIKVTHFRLPLKDRGCRGDGDAVSSDPDSLLTQDGPPSGEPDLDYTPDPLHRLLTETFDSLNITTFSVHLSKPEDVSENAENVRRQILSGLKPLSSFSSSSSSSQSSSSSESSAPTSSSSSLSLKLLSSLPSSSSAPSSSSLTHSPSSSSFSSSSASLSTPEISSSSYSSSTLTRLISFSSSLPSASDSIESNELENSKGLADPAPPEDRRPEDRRPEDRRPEDRPSEDRPSEDRPPEDRPSSGEGGDSVYRPTKRGFVRRPRPNSGSFLNKTHVNLRVPQRSPLRLMPETETRHSSSSSSSSVEVNAPEQDRHEDKGGTSKNQKFMLTERGRVPFSRGPPNGGYRRRPFLNAGLLQNQTRPNLRPLVAPSRPLHPKEQVSTEMPAASKNSDPSESVREEDEGRADTRTRPSVQRPNLKVGYVRRPQPNGGSGTNLRPQTGLIRKPFPNRKPNAGSRISVESQTKPREGDGTPGHQTTEQNVRTSTEGVQEGDQETPLTDGHSGSVRARTDEFRGRDSTPIQIEDTPSTVRGRPSSEETSSGSRSVTPPKRPPPTRTITAEHHTQVRNYTSGTHKEEDPKTNQAFDEKRSPPPDVPSSGVLREPLDSVGVTNRTSDGYTLVWDSPEGKYKNFVVTRKEGEKDEAAKQKEQEEDSGSETRPDGRAPEDHNRVPDTLTIRGDPESDKLFKKVLPGSARSFRFEDLPPQTEYTLTLLGKGPGLLSRLHKLVISTGPEPPSNIVFSKVTENSLTVSWTKPKSSISGFKVTYTHAEDGEPVSVSVDSKNSTLDLYKLTPGSSYEVTVISTLDLDESDPIKDSVMTLPDPPTHLRAVNVTDTTALLLWRPALAAIDKYAIVYGSGTGSELRVTVSGNAAEQQLSGLEGSTTYTVTVTSQLGSMESSPASTTFTTSSSSSGGSGSDGPRDLKASNVTPRTAMLSWKPPSQPVGSYRLTYQTEGQGMKEVIVDAAVTQYNLSRLHAGSVYSVQLQAERGGRYLSAISTEFTTGTLRFPFPTDCSQELLNGIWTSGEVEIFPQGKLGTPMMVYCDMETDGGGWTVFQRRKDGSVDFFRSWKEYVSGFGDLSGEFWLGLDRLHNLTKMTRMTLRVDLRNGGESVFAQYSTFEVAKRNYKLTVGGYSGTAGDSLSYHSNRIFSTKDRDPAPFITRCALSYRGGWWYKNCHEANLNGLYGIDVKHQGVIWTSWKGKEFSIAFTEMKMRPAAFRPPARG